MAQTLLTDGIAKDTFLIKDKFAIDLLNSIQVGNNLINTKSNNSNLFKRVINDITGKNHRHQESMNSTMLDGIVAANSAIEVLQDCQIKSITAINFVTKKLLETREGVMKLQDKVGSNELKINDLAARIDVLQSDFHIKFEQFGYRLDFLESKSSIDFAIEKWLSGHWKDYLFPIRMFLMFSELEQSKLGFFLQESDSQLNKIELLEYLSNRISNELKVNRKSISLEEEFFNPLMLMPEVEKLQLEYLVGGHSNNDRLLSSIETTLSTESVFISPSLLSRMSNQRIASTLQSEIFRSVA